MDALRAVQGGCELSQVCFMEADFNFATQKSNSPKEMKCLSAIVIYLKEKFWHIIG